MNKREFLSLKQVEKRFAENGFNVSRGQLKYWCMRKYVNSYKDFKCSLASGDTHKWLLSVRETDRLIHDGFLRTDKRWIWFKSLDKHQTTKEN